MPFRPSRTNIEEYTGGDEGNRCLSHHWFAHWGYPLVPIALRGAQQPARAVHSNQRFLGSRADRPHAGLMTPPPKLEGAPRVGWRGVKRVWKETHPSRVTVQPNSVRVCLSLEFRDCAVSRAAIAQAGK